MTHQHLEHQLSQHDRRRNLVVAACAAVSGILGYGIALGLARATEYAEQVEEDDYCHESKVSSHN